MGHPFRDTTKLQRTYWNILKHSEMPEYSEIDTIQTTAQNGELVASLLESGELHAPVLDIDFPVQVLRRNGRTCLILHGPAPQKTMMWYRLLQSLENANLTTPKTLQEESEWITGAQEDYAHLAAMPSLKLDVPVTVLPSTTHGHFHIYIDKAIFWGHYVEILQAMSRVGILEKKYVDISLKREMTMLYKPGVRNPKKRKWLVGQLFNRI